MTHLLSDLEYSKFIRKIVPNLQFIHNTAPNVLSNFGVIYNIYYYSRSSFSSEASKHLQGRKATVARHRCLDNQSRQARGKKTSSFSYRFKKGEEFVDLFGHLFLDFFYPYVVIQAFWEFVKVKSSCRKLPRAWRLAESRHDIRGVAETVRLFQFVNRRVATVASSFVNSSCRNFCRNLS
jgi:hypothetical protein